MTAPKSVSDGMMARPGGEARRRAPTPISPALRAGHAAQRGARWAQEQSTVAGAREAGIGRGVFHALGRPVGATWPRATLTSARSMGGFTRRRLWLPGAVRSGRGALGSGAPGPARLRSVTSLDLTTAVRKLAFTAGKDAGIRRGETITGAISGATATVAGVAVTSGAGPRETRPEISTCATKPGAVAVSPERRAPRGLPR